MAINKVIYDGETLMDVTDSTVSEENLLAGAVAYNAAGERITGAVVTAPVDSVPTEGSGNAVSSGGVFAAIGAAANVTASKVKFADGETFQQKYNSGELTGPAGEDGTSVTVKSVSESGADGGSNVVTFSDGKTLNVKNGSKGSAGTDGYTPVKGVDYFDGENGEDGTSVTVQSVRESGEDGGENIVTFSDGTTLSVKNGSKGSAGENGSPGAAGKDGATFTPSVDASGNLSWSNNGGLGNPATVNIKGPAGADGKNAEANRYTATLNTSDWSSGSGGYAYQRTVTISGVSITANTDFDVDVDLSGTDAEADALILEAFGLVTFADSVSGGIKFACATDKPGVNIPVNIRIYG